MLGAMVAKKLQSGLASAPRCSFASLLRYGMKRKFLIFFHMLSSIVALENHALMHTESMEVGLGSTALRTVAYPCEMKYTGTHLKC